MGDVERGRDLGVGWFWLGGLDSEFQIALKTPSLTLRVRADRRFAPPSLTPGFREDGRALAGGAPSLRSLCPGHPGHFSWVA